MALQSPADRANGLAGVPDWLAVGVAVGGLLLGVLEAFSTGLLSSGYKDAIAFLLLLAFLFFRPEGLFGALKSGRR